MPSIAVRLLRLAWPVALARIGIMGMGLCDAVVLGQLAPRELAHQALGWAPTAVLLVSAIGLLTGVQILAARALGAGTPEQAGGAWQRGLAVSFFSGALACGVVWVAGERVYEPFGIAPELAQPSAAVMRVLVLSIPAHLVYVCTGFFVEALQRPLASTWMMAGGNVVNLVLNLLWVPKYGAIGSAWATCGARWFLAIGLVLWVWRLPEAKQLSVRRHCAEPSYREFLRLGFAAAVSQAAEAGAFSGMTLLAGRIGSQAVAAYQIMLNLLALVFMLALGLASATAVLTSEALGRNAARDAARASWAGLALNAGLMTGIGLLCVVFARAIAHAYTADATISQLVAPLMPLAAASMLADGGQTIAASALRARLDNWFPTASHLLAYAVVMPALAFTLAETEHLGVRGLLYAILWSSVLSVSVLAARLWFLTRSSWRGQVEVTV